jgi:hypothetical protein
LQEGRENANIDAGLGFIWRISVQETFLLRIAAAFEAQTGFHAQRPPVFCSA